MSLFRCRALAGLLGSGLCIQPLNRSQSRKVNPFARTVGRVCRFHPSGRPGCAQCYETFRGFESVAAPHPRSVYHTGRCRCLGRQVHTRRGLAELQEQLQRFIEREEYEQAAVIRDKIRELKRELSGGR